MLQKMWNYATTARKKDNVKELSQPKLQQWHGNNKILNFSFQMDRQKADNRRRGLLAPQRFEARWGARRRVRRSLGNAKVSTKKLVKCENLLILVNRAVQSSPSWSQPRKNWAMISTTWWRSTSTPQSLTPTHPIASRKTGTSFSETSRKSQNSTTRECAHFSHRTPADWDFSFQSILWGDQVLHNGAENDWKSYLQTGKNINITPTQNLL